jgi:hypothetical protein
VCEWVKGVAGKKERDPIPRGGGPLSPVDPRIDAARPLACADMVVVLVLPVALLLLSMTTKRHRAALPVADDGGWKGELLFWGGSSVASGFVASHISVHSCPTSDRLTSSIPFFVHRHSQLNRSAAHLKCPTAPPLLLPPSTYHTFRRDKHAGTKVCCMGGVDVDVGAVCGERPDCLLVVFYWNSDRPVNLPVRGHRGGSGTLPTLLFFIVGTLHFAIGPAESRRHGWRTVFHRNHPFLPADDGPSPARSDDDDIDMDDINRDHHDNPLRRTG